MTDRDVENLETEAEGTEKMLQMKINGNVVNVLWEENESVDGFMQGFAA